MIKRTASASVNVHATAIRKGEVRAVGPNVAVVTIGTEPAYTGFEADFFIDSDIPALQQTKDSLLAAIAGIDALIAELDPKATAEGVSDGA